MPNRTKVYIAADWDGDKKAVEQLQKWNESDRWSLSFPDAHDMTQARDDSLNCSIKRSLSLRLNASKTFVLIVGENTISVRSGSCQYCRSYNHWGEFCARGMNIDYRSYIEYECEKAVNDRLKIVVLYNAAIINKTKCPQAVRGIGTHIPMWYYQDGKYYWDYYAIKNAIEY